MEISSRYKSIVGLLIIFFMSSISTEILEEARLPASTLHNTELWTKTHWNSSVWMPAFLLWFQQPTSLNVPPLRKNCNILSSLITMEWSDLAFKAATPTTQTRSLYLITVGSHFFFLFRSGQYKKTHKYYVNYI